MNYKEPELWRPILAFETLYEISSWGNVRSFDRWTDFGKNKLYVKGRMLKIKRRKDKYPFVVLSNGPIRVSKEIHRLVADHFIPNPENLPTVNHDNGDKDDNYVGNLGWKSWSGNMLHAMDTGLNTRRKLNAEQVLEIRGSNLSDIHLSKLYGVSKGNIWNIRQGKTWNHI